MRCAGGTIGSRRADTGVLEDPKLVNLYAPLVPARSDAGNSSGRMAGGDGVAAERT